MPPRRPWLRHPLARDIAVVLGIKVLALTALYLAFFSPSHRLDVTPEALGEAVYGVPPAAETRSDRDV